MRTTLRVVTLFLFQIVFGFSTYAITINETHVNVSCYGGNNGSIDITPFGGTSPYTFVWSNATLTEDLSNISAGTYTVTVSDLLAQTAVLSIGITEPSPLSVNLTAIPVSCNGGNNGAINTSRSGGTGPYSYLWNNGAFTQNRVGLTSGNYSVTITDSKGCTVSATVYVPQPNFALAAIAIPSPLACVGGPSGSVITNTTGGTPPYTYWWGGGFIDPFRLNLFSGNYCVTATDANGCTTNACATIPAYTPLTATYTQTNNICYGDSTGSVDLTPADGSTPYSFSWNNGAATEDISNLKAGNYIVTITDNNTCTISRSINITQPSFPISINNTVADPTCYGSNNGYINLSVLNGVPPYSYDWGSGITGANRTGLISGTFPVTVTDNNGCTASTSSTVTEPSPLLVSSAATDVLCYGASTGAIAVTATGSFAPYSYDWNDGPDTQNRNSIAAGNYSVTVIDNHGCSASTSATVSQPAAPVTINTAAGNINCFGGSNGWITLSVSGGTAPYNYDWGNSIITQNRTNLPAANYSVTVMDNAGCSYQASATVTQPSLLVISSAVTNVTCNGGNNGAIDLTVSGGTFPYAYDWGGGITTADRTGLSSGSYTVTITDGNGCTNTHPDAISQTSSLTVSISSTNVSCNAGSNGAISLSVSGGVVPYIFSWNDGGNTQNRNNIPTGNYSVTVADAGNCSAVSSASITQPSPLATITTVTNPSCSGLSNGSIDLSVNGGISGYSYSWSNNASTQDLNSLTTGNYAVVITDGNNCSVTTSVTLMSPQPLTYSVLSQNISCNGATTGSIDLTVNGGTLPYAYLWSHGPVTQDVNNLTPGNYFVSITDANSCSASASASITYTPPISSSITKSDLRCNGDNSGAIDLSASGGTLPYTFAWNNSATTEDLNGIAAGIYTVVITDAGQCSATNSVTVAQPPVILISSVVSPVTCFAANTGAINISVNGGVQPLSFHWNTNATTEDISSLTSASYSVTATDGNSCSASLTNIAVTQPTQIVVTPSITPVSCLGKTNGSIQLQVSGGSSPYTYSWDNQLSSSNIQNLSSGHYTVTVTDSKGCRATASHYVEILSALNIMSSVKNTACEEVKTGVIDISVEGGTPAYHFSWSNGNIDEDARNLALGDYTVTVTDSRDCSAKQDFNISFDYALKAETISSSHITSGEFVHLAVSANTDNDNMYSWTPAEYVICTACASTEANPVATTVFFVSIIDTNGCRAEDSLAVEVKPASDFFIPNVFTPNHDGANDMLELYGDKNNLSFLSFVVFNRWGEKVFESNDHHFSWDGTYKGEEVPAGIYTYIMKAVRNNSSKDEFLGSVTLLR
jgi:gliding motility-associated-like protein